MLTINTSKTWNNLTEDYSSRLFPNNAWNVQIMKWHLLTTSENISNLVIEDHQLIKVGL